MRQATDVFVAILAAVGAFIAPQVATVILLLFIYIRVSEIARRQGA
jgi:hypothetical protein